MTIGPATEARFAEAFADAVLISAPAAARVLDIDVRRLRELAEIGALKSVLVGRKTRRYAERDLREFLATGGAKVSQWPSTGARPASITTISRYGESGFTALRMSARKLKRVK